MKKILSLFLVFSLLFGVVGVLADTDQTANVTVGPDLSFDAQPDPVTYGTLIPGGQSIVNYTLSHGVSTITVSVNITNSTLLDDINWDRNNTGLFVPYHLAGFTMTGGINDTFPTKLMVPIGQPSGLHVAVIIYTVMEAI